MTLPSIGLGPSTSEYTDTTPRELWPDPEVVSEYCTDAMGKRAVLDLASVARSAGWSARITMARGAWPSVGQRPSRQRWSLAVRMLRDQERAVAVYVEDTNGKTWKWLTLYRWTIGQFPAKYADITSFVATIA